MKHLTGLSELRYLNLYGTAVTDAGLVSLGGLKNLQKLYLWQTKVSKSGATKLRQELPELQVDLGEYAKVLASIKPIKPKKAPVAINKICPLKNKPVAAGKFSIYQGQVIGFCCGKCKAAFDRAPDKLIDRFKEFKKAEGSVAANKLCPITQKPVADGHVSPFRGKLVGFCCGKCKASFDEDPDKFLPKLTALFPPDKGAKKNAKKGDAKKGDAKKGGTENG